MLGARLKAMVASHEIAMGESKAELKSPAILSVNLGMVVTLLSLTFTITGVQKQSEAALLHVRVDGVVGRR